MSSNNPLSSSLPLKSCLKKTAIESNYTVSVEERPPTPAHVKNKSKQNQLSSSFPPRSVTKHESRATPPLGLEQSTIEELEQLSPDLVRDLQDLVHEDEGTAIVEVSDSQKQGSEMSEDGCLQLGWSESKTIYSAEHLENGDKEFETEVTSKSTLETILQEYNLDGEGRVLSRKVDKAVGNVKVPSSEEVYAKGNSVPSINSEEVENQRRKLAIDGQYDVGIAVPSNTTDECNVRLNEYAKSIGLSCEELVLVIQQIEEEGRKFSFVYRGTAELTKEMYPINARNFRGPSSGIIYQRVDYGDGYSTIYKTSQTKMGNTSDVIVSDESEGEEEGVERGESKSTPLTEEEAHQEKIDTLLQKVKQRDKDRLQQEVIYLRNKVNEQDEALRKGEFPPPKPPRRSRSKTRYRNLSKGPENRNENRNGRWLCGPWLSTEVTAH